MPSLKTFRLRIRSVQSTQKITKAMKMVAAAKLRRAQEQAMAARPYAEAMDKILASLGQSFKGTGPRLLAGTGSDQVHLLIVATSDRGLCGAFNSSIVREARRTIRVLQAEGKTVKVLAVGRKGRDQLRRDYGSLIVETITDLGRPRLSFGDAQKVTARVMEMFAAGEFDVASVVFNRFKSAMTQIVTRQQLIPPPAPEGAETAAPATVGGEFARRVRIATGSFRALGQLLRGPLGPLTGFAFFSHKLLRWILPLLLIGMLLASALLSEHVLYRAMFLAQGAFYVWGVAGYLFRRQVGGLRYALIPYYLLAMHLAFLVGLVRFLSRRGEVGWRRAG